MSFKDRIFGKPKEKRVEILSPRSAGGGSPLTGHTGFPKARVPQLELEKIYRGEPIAFSIINRYTNAIVSPGYVVRCEDPEQQELWDNWLRTTRFKRNIHRAVKSAWIYGNGFIELVRNRDDNTIVGLKNVYSPTMDFQKTSSGRIIFDRLTKEPKGYQQEIHTEKGLEKIKVDKERIAHLKIQEIGEAFAGISPFEPLYKTELIRMNIDEAMGESAFRQAFPIYIAYVGLPDRDPSVKELDETHKEILKVGQKSVFTFPHYTKLVRLDSPSVEAVAKYADYFLDAVTAGTGLPRALLMPTPGVTYAALERLGLEWEKEVKEYQDFLTEQIEDEIFSRVVETNSDMWEMPSFKFKDLSPSMKLSKSRRLATLARAGLLVWDKTLEQWLRGLEDLPPIDEETHLGRPMISMNLSDDKEEVTEIFRELIQEIKKEE